MGALLAVGGGNSRVAASAARSATTDEIAVSLAVGRGGDGSGGIVIINPSGRRLATLSTRRAGREDSEPAWSPDGTRLAFTRTIDRRRSFQIYVMRADGKGVRRITRGRFDYSPSWSPDGRWIAYRSNGALRIVHPDGTGGRRVHTRSPTEISYPVWAPGGRVAYSYWATIPQDRPAACHQPGSGCGYVVSSRLDGSQRRRIVRGRDAHWTRDGRTIVYTGPDGGVYIASGSGRGGHLLGRGYRAEWSRDGSQIVYARMGNWPSQDSIWIMNRDGTGAHRISRGASSPAWRP
jgi:Tol biopolymer transport system component